MLKNTNISKYKELDSLLVIVKQSGLLSSYITISLNLKRHINTEDVSSSGASQQRDCIRLTTRTLPNPIYETENTISLMITRVIHKDLYKEKRVNCRE